MKRIKTILQIIFILIFVASCQSAKNVITGKEAQSKGKEFLVEKKNPLVVPPDFDQLPIPDEDIKSTQTTAEKNSNFEKLLKEENKLGTVATDNSSSTTEESILKKIKKK